MHLETDAFLFILGRNFQTLKYWRERYNLSTFIELIYELLPIEGVKGNSLY